MAKCKALTGSAVKGLSVMEYLSWLICHIFKAFFCNFSIRMYSRLSIIAAILITVLAIITARRSYASVVFVSMSCCNSVCLSHACFVSKPNNALRIF